jgi:SagB-type dehydrogenase family enzyme
VSSVVPTVQFASVVYGDRVGLDDPAESYHEAAKLYPATAGRQTRGIQLLERHGDLRQSIARAGRRHRHRHRLLLPEPDWPPTSLQSALRTRRSRPLDADSHLSLVEVSTILASAYGHGADGDPVARRFTPSGGALYPLELYPLVLRVEGADRAVHHYDPFDHALERLDGHVGGLGDALVDPTIASSAALLVVITGVFWRSRFKYGLRGYRFTLLEAGHAAQNALLTATALGLAALPLGGFYDSRLDAIVGAGGIDESVVYAVAIGSVESAAP